MVNDKSEGSIRRFIYLGTLTGQRTSIDPHIFKPCHLIVEILSTLSLVSIEYCLDPDVEAMVCESGAEGHPKVALLG